MTLNFIYDKIIIVEVVVYVNNYCTNCGKKLMKSDLICNNCNTPIIELPYNYKFVDSRKRKFIRVMLIIIGIIILCLIGVFIANNITNKLTIKRLQNNYIEPYLEENYTSEKYSITYDSVGKCIISGNCIFDPAMGCDGGTCQRYKYLDENECKSYYYSVKIEDKEFTLTVVNQNNNFYVVEGKNIYGEDKDNEGNENSVKGGQKNVE
jgi:hypothetical protein